MLRLFEQQHDVGFHVSKKYRVAFVERGSIVSGPLFIYKNVAYKKDPVHTGRGR
jgi:hypothetical protein